jgi:hypothetical protein
MLLKRDPNLLSAISRRHGGHVPVPRKNKTD